MKHLCEKIKTKSLFIKNFILKPTQVGALFPTSAKFCQEITKNIQKEDRENNYLEVGAGLGNITSFLVKKLGKKDRLTLVEINKDFCTALREKYKDHPQITIYEGGILDFNFVENSYDAIICSLPVNLFENSQLKQLLSNYHTSIKEGGTLSYAESSSLRFNKYTIKLFPKIKAAVETIEEFSDKNTKLGSKIIWTCLPAVRAFHIKIEK